MIYGLIVKCMLGIRECLSSLLLPPFIWAGCDFANKQENVTVSFFDPISFHECEAEAG